ncbi:hypothetical protein [Paenibacillus sp. Mc5Re-14]|nr:hypothetical protein [Paenibacillus sp. Mc5Re-14]
MKFKNKIDVYFDLQGDTEGQLLYYGMIGVMVFVMVGGTLGNLLN